jgi:hypothetical protein
MAPKGGPALGRIGFILPMNNFRNLWLSWALLIAQDFVESPVGGAAGRGQRQAFTAALRLSLERTHFAGLSYS